MHNFLPNSLIALLLVPVALTGCAVSPTNAPSTPAPASNAITGNWQASVVPASGTPAISSIAGTFNQVGAQTDVGQYFTAVVRITGPCFIATPLVPLQGHNKAGSLSFESYTVNGQYLQFSSTADATGSTMQGTYTVSGGCADGASGSFSATRYAPVTGTFTGNLGSASNVGPVVFLVLTQADSTTGSGTYLLTGTATLSGTGCSLAATAPASAQTYIQGSTLYVQLAASDGSGATATIVGTVDATGKSITPLTFSVQGGSCAGTYTAGTLQRR